VHGFNPHTKIKFGRCLLKPLLVNLLLKKEKRAGRWWLTPVIIATQEAEIRRITVGSQPGQIVHEILSHTKWAGRVAQGIGPEFKPQYCKKNKGSGMVD
jgi:hypothetical protein